jgi:hypothetical protein
MCRVSLHLWPLGSYRDKHGREEKAKRAAFL